MAAFSWPTWQRFAEAALLFAVTTFGSLALATWVLVRLPEDHLTGDRKRFNGALGMRIGKALARNLAAIVVIAIGLVLAIPGVPGQGLLTIVVGVLLLDVPGSRGIARRLCGLPRVLAGMNRVRARWGKPPLLPPPGR